ncbi:hypothetical protein ECC02_010609 [Trypanosoma cruzi]|uniref:Syntaxin binding protein n=1 Tax=Trypanosoma cruzi TaxID=5693 RepID=A0A7J6XQW2_TRYCR|nr:hypothetical protein ECC02_010609 [Trypanosoma cruzi]
MSGPVGILWGGLEAAVIDEEDVYWCSYRHCFLAQCVEELSVALKKLHAYHPGLAQGVEPKANLARLSSAVRAPPEFRERQARLSLHIDICARLVAQYREKRLAEAREVEQDIAVGHKPFRKNLEGVQQLTRNAAMPRPVRLLLLLLLVAASSTDELTEAKKQQPIRDGGLTPDAHLSANLEHVTRRAGSVQQYSTASAQSERSTSASASNAATDEDPFLKHVCMMMETADRNRTLRVGLSLASMERDHVIGPNGASGGQNSGEAGKNAGPFQGCGGEWENHPVLGGGGGVGTIALTTPQRIVLLLLGGVGCSERRSVHEISKRYGREVVIGETSMPRPEVCVFAGTWHPTAVGLRDKTRKGTHRGPKSGKYATTHDCGCLWDCVRLCLHSLSLQEVFHTIRVCVFQRPRCLPFAFVFLRVRLQVISLLRRVRLKKEGHLWSMHPRLQCLSTDADLSCQGICARFSLHDHFFFAQEATGGHS